jgi:DNA (cytosine-5)-methyltransferase 1
MRAIDFFCGVGGLTRGLLDAGIRVVAGFDIDERCRQTYEHNNRPVRFCQSDVAEIQPSLIWRLLGNRCTTDLLFAACAPCQPFSKQRTTVPDARDDGFEDFERDARLLGAFARLIAAIRPAHVLVENVPGLIRVPGFSTYRRFVHSLSALGYKVAEGVLDAKHFGVPQTRRRYVLIAAKRVLPSLPSSQYGPDLRSYLTVRDSISHYPAVAAGESWPSVPNHVAAKVSDVNLNRLRHTPHDGGDRRAWPRKLRLTCHQGGYEGHTDVYGRMAWDNPAPALTGRCNSISNGRYGHPCQDRAITLREAASLQTFADDYIFYGANQHIARGIGNAVPVRFAQCLGRHILSLTAIEGAGPR